MIYRIYSPCKINLHLDVHGKRTDGYHDLTSIFQMVSLMDVIDIEITNTSGIVVNGDFICRQQDNLIYKAAVAFFNKAMITKGAIFNVDKKVPAGGGIGGGSSNCGSVLRALNKIFNNILTDKELFDIALKLGSDVPFFLGSTTSLVEGRGEIVKSLTTIKGYSIVLVNPLIHISTGEAFQQISERGIISDKNSVNSESIVKNYNKGLQYFNKFKNSFEIGLFSDYTFIRDIKKIMYNENAIFSALSGSGSTMFGIFNKLETAEKAVKSLKEHNQDYKIYLVNPLEDFPELENVIL